jgi:hypothetical protein
MSTLADLPVFVMFYTDYDPVAWASSRRNNRRRVHLPLAASSWLNKVPKNQNAASKGNKICGLMNIPRNAPLIVPIKTRRAAWQPWQHTRERLLNMGIRDQMPKCIQ